MIKSGRKYIDEVAGILPGEWLTYGEVANRAGTPRGARATGQALLHLGDQPDDPAVPSWRISATAAAPGPSDMLRARAGIVRSSRAGPPRRRGDP